MKKILPLWILFLMVFSSAFSQVTTSNIRGAVVDDQSVPLFGANVVAVHTPTGTRYGAITNEDGRYNLLNLRVGGPYEVTISYVGFKTAVKNDIFLTLGKTFNYNLTMVSDSQALDEVVVVSDATGTFGSDRTGSETSVGRRELTRLPTITRSAQDFTRLEPTSDGNSFGGRNSQYNNFSLDGSIFNNPFGLDAATPGGQTNAQPISLDAIDQIQVSLAPYDVTQAGFTGASVNAVTKSGTNELKGTVYTFFRNQDLTGSKVEGEDIFVPDLTQTQFGVSIGGPIVKNKLFFFANFERDQREDLGSNFVANRGQSGNNVSRVSETDLLLVSDALAGLGYETGPFEGFLLDTESTKGIFKLDWNIDDNNRLALIYNFLRASRDLTANEFAIGRRGPDATTLQFANSGYEINNNIDSFLAELNSTFNNGTATNKLQIGYSFFDDFRNPFSTPAPAINIQQDGVRAIVAGHEPFSINNRLEQRVFQITDNLNFFTGNHTFTVGFSYENFEFFNSFNLGTYFFADQRGAVGVFADFPSVDSFLDAVDNGLIGDAINNAENIFAANNAVPIGTPGGWNLAETKVGQLAFYIQDDWNVTDNFKLTYGIRADRPLYFNTRGLIQENIDRKGGLLSEGGTYAPDIQYFDENGEPIFLNSLDLPSNDILWSPRLGFNWDVRSDQSFQIRGGTGVFSGRFPFVWVGNQVQSTDFFFYQTTNPNFQFPQVWRSNLGLDYRFENGIVASTDIIYTEDLNAATVNNFGAGTPNGTLAGVDNRPIYLPTDRATIFGGPTNAYVFSNVDVGYSFNWTVKVQKQFDNNLFASVAYNFLESFDANSLGAEISSDIFDLNPAFGNVNTAASSPSLFGNRHRIIGQLNKSWQYGGGTWGTSIGAFFEYAEGGRFSYTYSGDINNDGSFTNDLIFIPTAAQLQQQQFAAPEQREAFEAFIQQDEYLNSRRGGYAGRNDILTPWTGRWDVKILQDYNFQAGDKKNTIQFSVDILNLGNLINSNWGVVQDPRTTQPLGVFIDDLGNPVYSFDTTQTSTFVNNPDLISRWQMQFGLRYIFN
ncbi:TonB-dependent receptor [Flagellimonas sp.]|uniref:TonB-dependent receptor n=1 Tax=Flagellimonas sp. TaxID=2058762 RepID=UPI003F49C01D